jgi:TRAP-type C4-dicarboxylate transport system permease small subunit
MSGATTAANPGLKGTHRAAAWLADRALLLAALALIGITAVQSWQVFARYVLNDSPSWTEPVAILLMNTAMMFGAAFGVQRQTHFGFFIGVHAAPPPLRRILLATSRLVQAGVGVLLALWGTKLAVETWSVPLAGVALPQGVTFLPIAVGGVLVALFALELLLRAPDIAVAGE